MAKSKGTDSFKKVIENKLKQKAFADPHFRERLSNEKKNIDDCITYILNCVKKDGSEGFTDDEVFNMAFHYYMEDDVKVGSKISGNVVINQHVTLTPEEIEEAKKEAKEAVMKEERDRVLGKNKKKVPLPPKDDGVQTLF